ncbi:CotS family spore coat protein [Alloiococcus sp. CFN-8]|uniref:CotS family spore coat protein n=1 Tax=Alloiococcus sp. CFN-8 TaxID=3416081 RepID=UPI003CEF3B5A
MTEIIKEMDYSFLSQEILREKILKSYGLEKSYITQIKFKDTDKQRAVYKIETASKAYCLKKVYYSISDLRFIYSSLEWFSRNGISVPKLLPTLDGGRYVAYNSMLFILTPWIEGEKCNYDNRAQVMESCRNLAFMHKSTKGFIPIKGSTKRVQKDDIYASVMKHTENIIQCYSEALSKKDKFSKVFLDHYRDNYTLASVSTDIASTIDISNLSTSLCHLDYVNKNILFDKNDQIWVIDFDKCSIDYCAHDLSYFLRRLLKRSNTRWNIELAADCISAYSSINPLTPDDLKYIYIYLCFPQKFWKISRDYYNNFNKCNKTAFVSLLTKAVEHDEFHLKFLKDFKKILEANYHFNMR